MSPLEPPTNICRKHAYDPPNEHYRNLLQEASERAIRPNACSAGWLVPDDPTECDVVLFVAHSRRSAIQLLRKTLPKSTLSNESWVALDRAACLLEQNRADTDVPPSAQRPRSPIPSSSSPSTGHTPAPRSELDDTQNLRDASSEPDASLGGKTPPEKPANKRKELEETYTTTVGNNNRRAEESRGVKRRRLIGLVKPHESASPTERAAYDSMLPKDEITIAWIINQKIRKSTFYDTACTPYATAAKMLKNAHALGNQAACSDALSFLQSWRSHKTPFSTLSAPSSTQTGIRGIFPWQALSQRRTSDSAFRDAWAVVNFFECKLAVIHIQYRWAMAFLARMYAEKIAELEREDESAGRGQSRSRGGQGKLRSQAKKALLLQVSPEATTKDENIFDNRLQRATRWYYAARRLGWGSLCLMPHDQITPKWVEQKLRIGEWHIWLELVEKINPDVFAASKAFDSWLGSECIAGGPIEGKKMLRIEIEGKPSRSTYEVEEVLDSEDGNSDDDDDDDGDGNSDDDGQSQAIQNTESSRRSCQLTLVELFEPHQLSMSIT